MKLPKAYGLMDFVLGYAFAFVLILLFLWLEEHALVIMVLTVALGILPAKALSKHLLNKKNISSTDGTRPEKSTR